MKDKECSKAIIAFTISPHFILSIREILRSCPAFNAVTQQNWI
jgi:hypothetical protein